VGGEGGGGGGGGGGGVILLRVTDMSVKNENSDSYNNADAKFCAP